MIGLQNGTSVLLGRLPNHRWVLTKRDRAGSVPSGLELSTEELQSMINLYQNPYLGGPEREFHEIVGKKRRQKGLANG